MSARQNGLDQELVVLLDPEGRAIGTAEKRTVHHASTPLHLAFSCYLFDEGHRLLLSQRALHKVTWPGAWTNTCCGHPAPGEDLADAVRRRVRQELGAEIDDLRLVLPGFAYRAVMPDGVVEHEMCPVFVGSLAGGLAPDPEEVAATRWQAWAEVRAQVRAGTSGLSPWCVEQVSALPEDPLAAPERPRSELPPAARAAG